MNPLKESQIKTLKKLDCEDLARKIDEIVKVLSMTNEDFNKRTIKTLKGNTAGDFFSLPEKEQIKILNKVAKGANEDQRKFMEEDFFSKDPDGYAEKDLQLKPNTCKKPSKKQFIQDVSTLLMYICDDESGKQWEMCEGMAEIIYNNWIKKYYENK